MDFLLRCRSARPVCFCLHRQVLALALAFACGLAFAASVAAAAVPASSERYRWKPVAIGGGGFITGLSSDRSGRTRVARADVYGAYLWLDSEARWAQLVTTSNMPEAMHEQNAANEGVFEIVVAPSDPDRIYMAFKGGVFRSTDRGQRFVRLPPPPGVGPVDFDANSAYRLNGPFIAVDPDDPDLVLFATPSNGVWRSADGGVSWQVVSSAAGARTAQAQVAGECAVVWFEPRIGQAGGRVWVMSPGHGMRVSNDKGVSFTALPSRTSRAPRTLGQGDFATDGTFFGVDAESQSVWRYRAGAWTELTADAGLPRRRFTTLAIHPTTSQVYVFDEGGRIFVSHTGGDSWSRMMHRSRVGEGDPPWLHVSDRSYFAMGRVRFDPVRPQRMWAGTGTGVYYADLTASSRVEWISRTRGIEELVANDVVKPPGRPAVFAAWDFGIHVKDDLDSFSTTYGPKERVLIAAQQVAWSPSNPDVLVTNASDTRMSCCSEDGDAVLAGYSVDSGRHWAKFTTLPQPPGTSARDPWRMSFGSIALSADSVDNIVWAPSFHRSPYYTTDRGKSWSRVVLPDEVLPSTGSHSALHFHRKTLAADRVLSGVFYWFHSGDGANPSLAGLWVTRNGGARWQKVFGGEIALHSQHSAKLRAVPGRAAHLFFTSGVYGPFDTRLRRSTDGGATWSAIDTVDQVDDVAFGKPAPDAAYPTIFVAGRVAGRFGIWRSTDNAKSWRRVGSFPVGSLDQVTVIEGDPDVFGRVFVGFKGSGWAYGEPAACKPQKFRFPASEECLAVP